jgi:hypothetical protein
VKESRIFKTGLVREALNAGKTRYSTGRPCKHGHLSERMVSSGGCCECLRLRRGNYDRSYDASRAKLYEMTSPKRLSEYRGAHRNQKLEAIAGRPRPSACEICGGQERIVFDHCHEKDFFRGWICTPCNIVLGVVRDSPDRLRKLAMYLEDANGQTQSRSA